MRLEMVIQSTHSTIEPLFRINLLGIYSVITAQIRINLGLTHSMRCILEAHLNALEAVIKGIGSTC